MSHHQSLIRCAVAQTVRRLLGQLNVVCYSSKLYLATDNTNNHKYYCTMNSNNKMPSSDDQKKMKNHTINSTSFFEGVPKAKPIEIFALMKAYADDPFEQKVNCSVGAYRTDDGKPWVLPVVHKAELALAQDTSLNKEYLPILGMEQFSRDASGLLLGKDHVHLLDEGKAFGVHSLSGTGSLRVGAEFLANVLGVKCFYCSNPTWANHQLVFKNGGIGEGRTYRYWSAAERRLDLCGLLEDLGSAPAHSCVILHACAHNPTGCDPSEDQWRQIADVCDTRKLFPFFDSAYQGFASGDVDADAWAVRYFIRRGFQLFCAQSFAKNFGLYNERVGNLTVVTNNAQQTEHMRSQLTLVVRGMYSNPPAHGAHIVSYVFRQPQLLAEWKQNICEMSKRIRHVRQLLRQRLEQLQTPGDWSHITSQIGMFSYTGLTEEQCVHLVDKHHVYVLRSGRMSLCGITTKNVEYVANAIHDAVVNAGKNKM